MSCSRLLRSLVVVSLVTALTLVAPPGARAAESPPGPGTLRLEMIGAGPERGDGSPPAGAAFLVRNLADGATMATPSSAQLLGNDGGPCPGVGALCTGDVTLTVAATGTELQISVAQGPTDRLAVYSGDCDGAATTQNTTSGRVRLARGETKVCRVTFVRPTAGGVSNADTALLVRTSFDHDPVGVGRPNQRLDLRGGNASIASADLGELTDLSDPTSPCPLSAPRPLCEWAVAFDDDVPSPFRVQESPHPDWLPIFGGACDPRGTLPTGRALGGELVRCDIEHVLLESQDGTGRNAAVRFEVVAPAGPGSPDSSTLELRSFDGDALAAIDTQEMLTATGQPCPGVDLGTCTGDVGLTVDVDPRVALTERFTIHATALPPGYQAGFSGSCTTRTPVNGLPFGEIDLGVGALAACRVTVVPSPTPPPPPPVLSVADLRIREGSSGTGPANVRIDLSAASSLPIRVSASTSNGTATAPADYTAVSAVVTIPAGQSSVLVPVPIVGDVIGEPDETFAVTLGAPTGATIGDGTATVTIVNDDDRTPPVIALKPNVIAESKLAPVSVLYASPAATDNLDGSVAVTCVARSGAKFSFGSTTVSCSAVDRNGNVARSSFVVLVRLPTTSGAVTRPGASSTDALGEVHRRQPVQVDAGGFAPRTGVELVFITSTGDQITLARTRAGRDGRIDLVVRIPRVALGEGQMTAVGVTPDGSTLVRAWLLSTVPRGDPHH